MGNDNPPIGNQSTRKARNPDIELHLDGDEDTEDTLYDDGLNIKDDSETLAGTRGTSPGIIKP